MRINRNVTHEIFTTVKINEIIVEKGDTVQNLLDLLDELAWSARIVKVGGIADDNVSLLFEATP